jgi:hypothetical protein
MNLLDLIISPAYAAEGINADPSALSQLIPHMSKLLSDKMLLVLEMVLRFIREKSRS